MSPNEAANAILLVWLVALGGAIGSFLNVVVYRVPRGLSLSRPGSHCPACKHAIRWHDNVPVFGWIRLRGRCRDCGTRISPRYPTVEAITAGVFLLVAVVEGLSGGSNLPVRSEPVAGGVLLVALLPEQLAGIVGYHLLLLSTLLAAAGIEYDRQRVPFRLLLPVMAVGWLAPAVWPHLHPVPAWAGLTGPLAGLADGIAGLAAGLTLGFLARPLTGASRSPGFAWAAGCVGLFLGWQAVVPVVTAAVGVHLIARGIGLLVPRVTVKVATAWLAMATLFWILGWERIVAALPVLG